MQVITCTFCGATENDKVLLITSASRYSQHLLGRLNLTDQDVCPHCPLEHPLLSGPLAICADCVQLFINEAAQQQGYRFKLDVIADA